MAGTIYTVLDCGEVAARGDYEESGKFVWGRQIYQLINNTDYNLYTATSGGTSGFCWVLVSRPGGVNGTGSYTNYYNTNGNEPIASGPDAGIWFDNGGELPLPTVILKSGSIEPASNLVLASFL